MIDSCPGSLTSVATHGLPVIRAQHGIIVRVVCKYVTMQLGSQARLTAAGVTAREAEVLAAVGSRLTNREIAARMFISVRTVESHVSSLLRKLALPGRAELVELAQQVPEELVGPAATTSFWPARSSRRWGGGRLRRHLHHAQRHLLRPARQ
jgi:DNA-binding CsgD family transcriptional regulator